MECKVEFDYVAQEPDELTIKKGEIIKNVTTKMDGWYEGTLNGKTGVFPDNFVKVLEKPVEIPEKKPAEVVLRKNPNNMRRVKVLFSYAPEQDDELPLEVGDFVEFIEEVEEGWWRGKLKGREGIFPSNFVQEVEEAKTNGSVESEVRVKTEEVQKETSRNSHTKAVPDVVPFSTPNQSIDEPAPELPPKPVRELARCFYPYKALNEDELSLAEGDIITIISKNCEDEGWWRGELRGKIGMFPDNFVKSITPGEVQTSSNGPQPKQIAQERGVPQAGKGKVPPADLPTKTKKDSIPSNTSVTDGVGSSKPLEKDKPTEQKVRPKSIGRDPQLPIAPKVGHAATSPIIAAFHSNLFQNQKPPDAFRRSDPMSSSGSKDDKLSDESEEFNSVERTETLSHLTATRAKAPKRRPPSAVIARENEPTMQNGSHSYDSSLAESPPPYQSTPNNTSVTSNGTMSDSYTTANSGSFLSQSRDKEGSPTPNPPSSKPKKQAPPWMAELKQTQDKKRGLSPGATAPPSSGSPAAPTTPPVTTSTPSQPPPKEVPAKAPPLPAKPSAMPQEKPLNNLNHSNSFGSSNKPFSKKSPSPAPPVPVTNHTSNQSNTDEDSNKGHVPYEKYAALENRVTSLENEVETLKRQIKLLMDRDLRGHIV